MKTLSLALLAALTVATFTGCTDSDTVDPGNNTTFFPLTAGTTWSYSSQTIDTTGALSGPVTTDSLVVLAATQTIGGRTASMIVSYHSDGSDPDTAAYIADANTLSAFLPLSASGAPGEGSWVKIADRNATSWTAYDSTATIQADSNLSFTIHLKLNVEKVGSESVTVPAGTFNATHYKQTLTTTISIFGIPATSTNVSNVYHMEGVGLVKTRQEVGTSNNPTSGGVTKSEGNLQQLLRYSVK